MGRPLNKKYFGNRNIGTGGYQVTGGLSNSQNYSDDRIGGEGVSSVLTLSEAGNYINRLPTKTAVFSAPQLPGGVTAVGLVQSEAQNCNPVSGANGSGYSYGDILTDANGATWRVLSLKVMTVTKTANGSDYDNDNNIVFDSTINAKWTTALTLDVTSNTGGALGNFTVTQYGVWTGSGAPTSITAAMASTRDGVDQNGQNAAFTLTWGVNTAELVTSPTFTYGDTIATGASNTTTVSPAGGTGCQLDVGYKVVSLSITQKGSGYTTAPTIAFTTVGGGETRAVGTTNLTTDSGAVGTAGNQENAIVVYALTANGGSNLIGDIIKQVSTTRYKVKTTDGIAICKLVTDGVANNFNTTTHEGEVTITATDANGNTYYVSKLTAHKATLVRLVDDGSDNDWLYATGAAAPWSFAAPSGTTVQIANA